VVRGRASVANALLEFMKRVWPTNHFSCRNTRMIGLSCGITVWAQVSFVSSQFTHLTDGQTDGRTSGSWLYRGCMYTFYNTTQNNTLRTRTHYLHRVPKKLSRFVFVRTSSNFHQTNLLSFFGDTVYICK